MTLRRRVWTEEERMNQGRPREVPGVDGRSNGSLSGSGRQASPGMVPDGKPVLEGLWEGSGASEGSRWFGAVELVK